MPRRDEGFIVVRKFMMRKLKLHGVPLLLYARIHGFTVNGGEGCFETQASLANDFNVSTRAIGKALKLLKQRGLVVEDGTRVLKNGRSVKVYKAVFAGIETTGTNCPSRRKFAEQSSNEGLSAGEESSDSTENRVPTDKKSETKSKESKGGDRFDEYSF